MEFFKSERLRQASRFGLPILGAGAGYAYYYFIGCASGTCPITSNPWSSIVYGAVLGFLLMPKRTQPRPEQPSNAADNDIETTKKN